MKSFRAKGNEMNRIRLIIILSFVCLTGFGLKAETIQVLSYHNHPPFINSLEKGLTYDFVDYLNQRSQGKFKFKVRVLPRKRLNIMIKQPGSWIVIWVHPIWFGDKKEEKYLWFDLFEDKNSIISHIDNRVEYNGPESLKGMKFGGIAGHRYVGIDELVAKGLITRIDGDHERNIVRVLLKGRLDVILLPNSTINYLKKEMFLNDQIYISKKFHQVYKRKCMIPKNRDDLMQYLISLNLSDSDDWKTVLTKHGFENR